MMIVFIFLLHLQHIHDKNFYTIGVSYSIQSPTDLGRYASRDYVIEEKNIEKVLDLVAKYNLYKFKS